MEYAVTIANIINGNLKKAFPEGIYNSIAKVIADRREDPDKGGKSFPAIVEKNGEAKPIDIGENTFEVYHRCISIQSSPSNKPGFGRALNPLSVKMKMCMILFSDITKTKLSPDELALQVHGLIARKNLKSIIDGVKNTSILINDTILNETQVFGEEFKNIDFFLGPEHSMIKINYTVESTVNQKCFNTVCKQTS